MEPPHQPPTYAYWCYSDWIRSDHFIASLHTSWISWRSPDGRFCYHSQSRHRILFKFPCLSQTTLCPIADRKVLSYIERPPSLRMVWGEEIVLSILSKTSSHSKEGWKIVVSFPLWFSFATSSSNKSLSTGLLNDLGMCKLLIKWISVVVRFISITRLLRRLSAIFTCIFACEVILLITQILTFWNSVGSCHFSHFNRWLPWQHLKFCPCGKTFPVTIAFLPKRRKSQQTSKQLVIYCADIKTVTV